jgi:hypothetical protein
MYVFEGSRPEMKNIFDVYFCLFSVCQPSNGLSSINDAFNKLPHKWENVFGFFARPRHNFSFFKGKIYHALNGVERDNERDGGFKCHFGSSLLLFG